MFSHWHVSETRTDDSVCAGTLDRVCIHDTQKSSAHESRLSSSSISTLLKCLDLPSNAIDTVYPIQTKITKAVQTEIDFCLGHGILRGPGSVPIY